MAVTTDGRHVYAAEQNGNAIAIFTRTARNRLEYTGCISRWKKRATPNALSRTRTACSASPGLALSPDGSRLYAVSYADNALVTFKRDTTTGALEYVGCVSGSSGSKKCAVTTAGGLASAANVVVSPDASRIYVVSLGGGLATFAPSATAPRHDRGGLPLGLRRRTRLHTGRDEPRRRNEPRAGACGRRGQRLALHGELLRRERQRLQHRPHERPARSPLPGSDSCLQAAGASAGCAQLGNGLNAADGIAASPDGRNIYIASRGADEVACGSLKCTDTVSAVAAFKRVPLPAALGGESGGGGGGGTPPPPATPAPALAHLLLSPSTIHRKGHKARSAQLTYTDTEPATTTVTVEQRLTGKRKAGRCVRGRAHSRKARCTLYATVATLVHNDLAGANHLTIRPQMGRRKLAPGSYLLLVLVANAASGASRPLTIGLRVL